MDLREIKQAAPDFIRHPWETARLKILFDLLKKHVPNPRAVADIGCGDCYVLSSVKSRFPDCAIAGTDPALTDARPPVFKDMADAAKHLAGPAAAALYMDVLEHVPDDRALIKEAFACGLADEKTVFIITVPAFACLFSEHDRRLGHLRRYTAKSLRAAAGGAGLHVLESGYFFTCPLALRALGVLVEKVFGTVRKKPAPVANWQYGKLAAIAAERVLLADWTLSRTLSACGLSLPGLSAYAVCRRGQ